MTKHLLLVTCVIAALSAPAFAGGNSFTYNENYSTDVGPNLRNLGYAGLGASVLGALLAPRPVIVAGPQGGGYIPYGPGPGSDGASAGFQAGLEAGRAARIERAVQYHQDFDAAMNAGYNIGLGGQ